MVWPGNKRFAFSIVDDTDFATVENTGPVYRLLAALGLRTTKTIWTLPAGGKPTTGGHTMERPDYRSWILDLRSDGFEIALHGVADGSSDRARVLAGLNRFQDAIGYDPRIHVNHVGQKEAVYWGIRRFNAPFRWLYTAYRRSRELELHDGSVPSDTHFWGDVCQSRVRYVRNMVFLDVNTLKSDPLMPYRDPSRPYVPYWFSSSYGATVDDFCKLISEPNQDRLLDEGGACIVYTHLGDHFAPLQPRFQYLIRRLAALPGWFVPASTLLDYIGEQRGWSNIDDHTLTFEQMQWVWMAQQVSRIGSRKAQRQLQELQKYWNTLVDGRLPPPAASAAPTQGQLLRV